MKIFWFIYIKSALHVSSDVFAHHQEHITVTTASGVVHWCCCWLVLRTLNQPAAASGRNSSSVLMLLASCQQICVTYIIAVYTVKNSWWWTEELSETCRFYSKNKFEKLVHLVGFIIRIFHNARSPESQIHFAVLYRKSCLYDDTHARTHTQTFLSFSSVLLACLTELISGCRWRTFGIMISRGRGGGLMYRVGKDFCLFIHQKSHSWTTEPALVGWETHV